MAPRSGVAVVGSISADLTVFASALPRPGETVIGETFSMVLGGKGANQALAAVRAGAPTFMIGAVGNDHFGELTLETLRADGVDTSGVLVLDGADRDRPHPGRCRLRRERHRDRAGGQPPAGTRCRGAVPCESSRDRISVVLVQLETPLEVVQRVTEVCRALELRLILDPAPAQPLPDGAWSGVFAVKPNETEAAILTGQPVTDQRPRSARPAGSSTAGSRWPSSPSGPGAPSRCPATPCRCCPRSPFARSTPRPRATPSPGHSAPALAGGLALPDALRRALAASALAVTVRGASPSLPTAAAVDAFLLDQR